MDAKQFFFEAMMHGWAASAPRTIIPGLPGSKSTSFRLGDYSLLDCYFAAPDSNSSYGMKIIWLAEKPIWVMNFGGWYDKKVVPFLKRALMCNYRDNIFLGGRGPERLEGEDHTLQYLNEVKQNDFGNFQGYEHIIATSDQIGVSAGQKLGEHHYFGGLLA